MGERIHLHIVSSTSDYLREKRAQYGDFSFVSADLQTSGKGRNGRSWVAEEGKNLTFSFLLKDPRYTSLGPKITLAVASIVAQRIEALGIDAVSIKWPNDIYLHGKKAVGILLEGSLPDYLIVGIGINVNQTAFSEEYRIPPTSLSLALGKKIDLPSFRESLFDSLEEGIRRLPDAFGEHLSYFSAHDYLFGKKVSLEGKGHYQAIGVDPDFNLLLKEGERIFKNASGEIRVLES
ncbi:MAG: biotin--[acetyl-CoA-carboxylase] ligase [Bacilli bacterium]|nr:biotin--[acetyl-CoA-carboxylase] ligase [Bacilli bacterium]